jgi:hypothetical protein
MRGEPHRGLAAEILRINSRMSGLIGGLPGVPLALMRVQWSRNRLRCHAITDLEEINQRANAFEMETGSGRHYEAHKLVSVQEATGDATVVRDVSLMSLVSHALKDCLADIAPPA